MHDAELVSKEGVFGMFAQLNGYRFNHVDNANKLAQPVVFSKMKAGNDGAGLEDFQRVNASGAKQTGYDPDGISKDTSKAARKEHLEKMFNLGGEGKPKSEILKTKGDLAADHLRNKHDGFHGDCPLCECETCKNRRYQDQSNDSAVSFQQATRMRPEEAAHKVRAHEMEHVRREQFKAKQDGNVRIVSQSVQIKTSTCPECGKNYVSGGVTRTATKHSDPDFIALFNVGAEDMFKNGAFDATA